jgi:23S rRNA (cytosine1962-C5)-methyltransferase
LGRENQALSGLDDKPIRWIVEDAVKFVQREIKRGNKYECIIFDPPKYGMGPKKERWEFFKDYPVLCELLEKVLSEKPLFIVVTAYALESKPAILLPPLEKMLKKHRGKMTHGELVTLEKSAGRKISYSITARWEAVDSG